MKKVLPYLMMLQFLLIAKSLLGQLDIVKNGKSNYSIYFTERGDSSQIRAANLLHDFLNQAAHVSLPVGNLTKKQVPNYSIVLSASKSSSDKDLSATDGFVIKSDGNSLFILGNNEKSYLYGVQELLKRFVGVKFFAKDEIVIPSLQNIIIPKDVYIGDHPYFTFRSIMNYSTNDTDLNDWYRLEKMFGQPSEWGLPSHSFFKLVPPATYFGTHPEYYSLVKGVRTPSQLCLSNQSMQNILITQLKSLITANQSKKYWMVGQEDLGIFCQCEQCEKLYSEYGGYSGALLYFINKVAAQFPNKIIATFAYHESLIPPTSSIQPSDNVLICFAPIEAFQNKSFQDPINAKIGSYLKTWGKIANRLMVWDYIGDYSNSIRPYPNLFPFQEKVNFIKSCNVKMFFAEDNDIPSYSDMKELKAYVLAKLLWNPNLDQNQLIQEFCKAYYGNASSYILQYLNAMNNNAKDDKLRFFGGTSNYLNNNYLQQYDSYLENASVAVESDPILLNRVNVARIPVDFYLLQRNSAISNMVNATNSLYEQNRKLRLLQTTQTNKLIWIKNQGKLQRIDKVIN